MSYSDNNVVFFDSECVLCGNFLKVLLRIDKNHRLKFASLQSDYSTQILPEDLIKDANYKTVVFLSDKRLFTYSDAVLQIFKQLGLPWSLFFVFKIMPKTWRDKIYMLISNNRYSWFGKSSHCIIPDESLQARFVHPIV